MRNSATGSQAQDATFGHADRLYLYLYQRPTTVRDMTAQRHSGGRKSKGNRQALLARVPEPVGEAVRARAEARGISMSDYIASILALNVGMPELAVQSSVIPAYEELPIADVA